ncbi:MAG TPA: type 4a pilus biogenesis protein PilO [Tepidisphaeraceae bacterium]|nr:type 4a pilus biogenesis protein PilO [Tepidisphaeraceae bacterium]
MLSLKQQIVWFSRVQWTLLSLLLLLVTGFFFVAYKPHMRQLADLQEQIDRYDSELTQSKDQTRILPDVAADVEKLKVKLAKFKTLPRQQELAQFIKDIAQLGQQANLKKFELTRGVPARGARLNELPIQLTFEGDFVSVYSFLRHAEELQRLTRVPSMNIKSNDKDGQVKVQMTMNIYFAADSFSTAE